MVKLDFTRSVQQLCRSDTVAKHWCPAFRILGEGQLSLTKFLILTDTPQDLKDFPKLLEHVLERFRPEQDLFILSNVSMDTLDYTSGKVNEGSKAIMLGLGDPSANCRANLRPIAKRWIPSGSVLWWLFSARGSSLR